MDALSNALHTVEFSQGHDVIEHRSRSAFGSVSGRLSRTATPSATLIRKQSEGRPGKTIPKWAIPNGQPVSTISQAEGQTKCESGARSDGLLLASIQVVRRRDAAWGRRPADGHLTSVSKRNGNFLAST